MENKENMENNQNMGDTMAALKKYAVKQNDRPGERKWVPVRDVENGIPPEGQTIGCIDAELLNVCAFSYDSILMKMQDTHARKNSDYGDAAYKGYKKFGDYYFLVQLHNKLSRLESLTVGNKSQQVKEESIDDTLMDMANYAVMYLESRHRDD